MKMHVRVMLFALVVLSVACQPANPTPTEIPVRQIETRSVVTIAVGQTATAPISSISQYRVVVIDTDMAPDDWGAILYLLKRPDVKVKAITVAGTGEAHCAPGVRNVLGLLTLAGYNNKIPVACGRETPLKGNHAFPNDWRQGADNLLGLTLPKGQNTVSNLDAVELLTSTIQSSSQKVTLLALGPLTNIADAVQSSPSLVDNVEMIYIMGGAINVPGNIAVTGVGIDNQVAEWNIYVDPFAANVVFRSRAPITLVFCQS
jgi:pyrimidine-specific ribonucleoside hydrolase